MLYQTGIWLNCYVILAISSSSTSHLLLEALPNPAVDAVFLCSLFWPSEVQAARYLVWHLYKLAAHSLYQYFQELKSDDLCMVLQKMCQQSYPISQCIQFWLGLQHLCKVDHEYLIRPDCHLYQVHKSEWLPYWETLQHSLLFKLTTEVCGSFLQVFRDGLHILYNWKFLPPAHIGESLSMNFFLLC